MPISNEVPLTIQIAIYVITFLFFATIVLGSYSIAKMGTDANIKLYWLGYVPILQFYVIGKLIETIDLPSFRIPKAEFIFPLLPIIATLPIIYATNYIVKIIVILACSLMWLYAWNTFFLLYCRPLKKANIYTFIGGILLLPLYIFVFLLRNNKPYNS